MVNFGLKHLFNAKEEEDAETMVPDIGHTTSKDVPKYRQEEKIS